MGPFSSLIAATEKGLQDIYQPSSSSFDVLPNLPAMFSEEELMKHQLAHSQRKDPRQTITRNPAIAGVPGLAHPLSFNEEQMLRLFVTDPRSMAYNLAAHVRSKVPLTPEQCELSHRIILERHEVLRSAFSLEDPKNPTRKVMRQHRGGFYSLAIKDEASANAINNLNTVSPLELGVSGIRCMYAPSADNFGYIFVNMHHILADNDALLSYFGESQTIQELLYYGYSKEAIMERLPKLPVQFTDFAYWQKSMYNQGLLKPDLAYWDRQVVTSQPPMVLDVPIDTPRPRVWVAQGENLNISFNQDILNPVMTLQPRASPFALVITNFSLALMRMANQRALYMATAFALRALPSVANLIGNFLNMLPMRVSYDLDEPYLDIVSRVATTSINVQKYNMAPFIQLVNDTQPHFPVQDPSRNPVYQSMVDIIPSETDEINDDDEAGLKGVLDCFLFGHTKNGFMFKLAGVYSTLVMTKQTMATILMHTKALANWAALHAKLSIPRMLPTYELAQEAEDAKNGVTLTHVLVRGKSGLPSVAAISSGPEALTITHEQHCIRAARRFKMHSALEFGSDIPQHLLKTAPMPTPLAPKSKPRKAAASRAIVTASQAMVPTPEPSGPPPPAASIIAPVATAAAPALPSTSIVAPATNSSTAMAVPPSSTPAKAPELSPAEEMALRRAEAARRRERSHKVAARWAENQRDTELIPLSQDINPPDEAEAFPRVAARRQRGFAAYAASRLDGPR